ncbi:alpha-E domain-containing protein [Gordonia sp. ABSL1-1]|uniref:alpha-E domain-containing protein n=1 Tax=Gordonia sp. ABSL1-1 TaxID=3053923 RepID=UPI0025732708|nr:alpha-E domain-containing protein [Gordonia sp. ABSL1-1]MDL9935538.1 alpha-E domain-containing protein [Gordonia sp. ABSL1-1]
MMLARNAESLYWIGRYVERADDIARILDVAIQDLLEDTTVDVDRQARLVVQVLGLPAPDTDEPLDVWSLTDRVAFDKEAVGSIVDLVRSARENARGAREVISSELWECLNATFNGLETAERRSRRLGPHEFLSYVKNRAAMFAGLADATLSHDDGYRYLLLGRSVERVDMTIRMLLARAGDRASSPAWVNVLVSAGAHDTYLRTYRGALDAENIVEFMLLDRLFPRSVFAALSVAEQNLSLLEKGSSRVGAQARAQLLLGRARSSLEFLEPGKLLDDLPDRLVDLQDSCRAVNEAVTAQYFSVSPYVSWADARVSDGNVLEESEL